MVSALHVVDAGQSKRTHLLKLQIANLPSLQVTAPSLVHANPSPCSLSEDAEFAWVITPTSGSAALALESVTSLAASSTGCFSVSNSVFKQLSRWPWERSLHLSGTEAALTTLRLLVTLWEVDSLALVLVRVADLTEVLEARVLSAETTVFEETGATEVVATVEVWAEEETAGAAERTVVKLENKKLLLGAELIEAEGIKVGIEVVVIVIVDVIGE